MTALRTGEFKVAIKGRTPTGERALWRPKRLLTNGLVAKEKKILDWQKSDVRY